MLLPGPAAGAAEGEGGAVAGEVEVVEEQQREEVGVWPLLLTEQVEDRPHPGTARNRW